MNMQREIQNLARVAAIGFTILLLGTLFWAAWERDNLRARDDNPRKVLDELNIQRGQIVDRQGTPIAYTLPADNLNMGANRVYPYPEVVMATGYYSYQFGQAGIEEYFDSHLRGEDDRNISTLILDNLLNRFIEGGDVRSTLDLPLQSRLYAAMQQSGYWGAALVVGVPDGDIRALVSVPDFDPNSDDELGRLVRLSADEPTTRLLNRVTNGRYQPGGALQTLLMSVLLANNVPLDAAVDVAPVTVDDLELGCLFPTDADSTWQAAYLNACPTPFVAASDANLPIGVVEDTYQAAGFWTPQNWLGLPPAPPVRVMDITQNPDANIAGQGALTVTPLQMVAVISSVINQGNGVVLHLVDAIRQDSRAEWEPVRVVGTAPAVMQPRIADTLRATLESRNWGTDANPLYGHISEAYAGNRKLLWFLGWVPQDEGAPLAIVIVLEGRQGAITPQDILAVATSISESTQ